MLLRLLVRRTVQIALLLLLLLGAVLLRLQDPPVIKRLRYITFDYYNKIMPRTPADDVLIIDIDEESIRKLGQWPWPRVYVANLLKNLDKSGARAVVFDVVFSERDRTSPAEVALSLPQTLEMKPVVQALRQLPDNDSILAQEIAAAGNVVTGFVAANQYTKMTPLLRTKIFNVGKKANSRKFVSKYKNFTTSLPELSAAAAGNGSFIMQPESDGVVRRVPLLIGRVGDTGNVDHVHPALSLEAIRVALGKKFYQVESYGDRGLKGYGIQTITVGDYNIPTDEAGNIWVYYTGRRPGIYVPAWKVLSGEVPVERIKDKIVLIGTSAIGLLDLRSSPLTPVLPGVEVHAEIIEQILHGDFLRRPRFLNGAEVIVTVIIALFIVFLAPFIGTGSLAMLAGLVIAGGGLGGIYAYQHIGWLLAPVYPSLTIVIIFIASSILTNLRSEVEKRAVRHAFSHYISPDLMDELANHPDKLKLGGEVRDMSVMFTDIRNFTTIAERMDPDDLIKMMNDFLTPMTACVQENRGTVDKYMGDAIMAFWNAPLDDPNHGRHSCKTALEMLVRMEDVNDVLQVEVEAKGRVFNALRIGIGIHSGKCSVGNMGSRQRFAYSALGDTVNLASRLEGQTKQYGVSILISEAVHKSAPEYAVLEIDLLTVKGRSHPERIYALMGGPEKEEDEVFMQLLKHHKEMLQLYRSRSWDEGLAVARECRKIDPTLDKLYDVYIERMTDYKTTPPPAGWQGAWIAKEK